MSTYEVEFERVGRNHAVMPLSVTVREFVQDGDTADAIASAVYQHVRPMLASSDVEVVVNLEELRGVIYCGFHNGGQFTVKPRD